MTMMVLKDAGVSGISHDGLEALARWKLDM